MIKKKKLGIFFSYPHKTGKNYRDLCNFYSKIYFYRFLQKENTHKSKIYTKLATSEKGQKSISQKKLLNRPLLFCQF